jgi:predicted AlkP superfamily phosphohydrolase/phosphomutase
VITAKRYDFAFFLIRATDWLQHHLHKQIIEGDRSKSVMIAREVFALVDNLVKDIMQKISSKDSLIVMSDHGFTTYKQRFYINDWLKENGYLKTSTKATESFEKTKYSFLFDDAQLEKTLQVPGIVSKFAREHHSFMKLVEPIRPRIQKLLDRRLVTGQPIDVERSIAFSVEESAGSIYINKSLLSSSEAEDIRKELVSKLSSIGSIEAHDSKILFGSHVAETVPDIYLTSSRYWIRRGLYGTIFSDVYQSHHRRAGILALSGDTFEKPPVNPTLLDLAPTILHIMKCAIPNDMQGRILTETFNSASDVAAREIKYIEASSPEVKEEEGLSDSERQVIEERLKKLGYI